MQPALPTLVRQWVPRPRRARHRGVDQRHAGRRRGRPGADHSAGAAARRPKLAAGFPGVVGARPGRGAALSSQWCRARARTRSSDGAARAWWPDWKNPLIWLLGLTFGSNNALLLRGQRVPAGLSQQRRPRRPDRPGARLDEWLAADRVVRSDGGGASGCIAGPGPISVFGPMPAVGVLGIVLLDGIWVVLAASVTGFSLAVTFVVTFALPPVLAPPGRCASHGGWHVRHQLHHRRRSSPCFAARSGI